MPGDELVISAAGGEVRAAFLADGVLRRLAVERPDGHARLGDILLGRVSKVAPQVDAAFVDIGFDRAGFIGLSEARPEETKGGRIGDFVSEGEALLVQVLQEPVGGKGAKLTSKPTLTGRYVVLLPGHRGIRISRQIVDIPERARLTDLSERFSTDRRGWIVRSAAEGVSSDAITREATRLQNLWAEVTRSSATARPPELLHRGADDVFAAIIEESGRRFDRVVVDCPNVLNRLRVDAPDLTERWELFSGRGSPFDDDCIEEQIEGALGPNVPLPCGGVVTIAETPAVVSIDVDTGAATGSDLESSALRVNLEACTEIARQIRLRNLAGHIVIDFVPMRNRENRTKLLDRLRRDMADDRRRVQVAGFTRFGLMELTRKRHGLSLAHRMNEHCGMCAGSGRTKSAITAAHESLRAALTEARRGIDRRPKITAAPAVIAALAKDAAPALRETEAKLGRRIILEENPAVSSQMFTVTLAGDREE